MSDLHIFASAFMGVALVFSYVAVMLWLAIEATFKGRLVIFAVMLVSFFAAGITILMKI